MAENLVKVAGLASDNLGCGYYRLINPINALRDVGYDAQWSLSWQEFLPIAERADIVILQRATTPQALEAVLAWRKHKLVLYELDDLIHDIPATNPAFSQYKQGSAILANATRIIRECDGIIVSSYELWRYYHRLNANVVWIPNFIDFRYRDWDKPFPKSSRLTVGWSGGSQHQSEAETIADLFRFVLSRYNVDVVLYCHPHFAQMLLTSDLPPHRMVFLPVRPFVDYPFQLGAMDIGLAPLENTRFNRAKCLDADTAVWTPKGIARVADLRVGDWVWNGTRFVHVLARQHEGETLGIRVHLECGVSIDMTLDHRVLSSIGWLNAGKLRKGDEIQLLPPHYTGHGQRLFAPLEAARLAAVAFCDVKELTVDDRIYRRSECLRLLRQLPVRDIFTGWSDEDAVQFMQELIRVASRTDRRGVSYLVVRNRDLVQCLAEFCLVAGIGCRVKRHSRSCRLELTSYRDTSRVVGIETVWLDAVDIQVEGEIFCANGIASHNSSLKPLEYMARGVVTVASDLSEYRLLWKQGAPIVLARTRSEWYDALSRLIEDEKYRSGFDGSRWVRERYDLHANIHRYVQAFQQFAEWKRLGRRGPAEQPALERNTPCPCGSGKRYGRCCYPAFG